MSKNNNFTGGFLLGVLVFAGLILMAAYLSKGQTEGPSSGGQAKASAEQELAEFLSGLTSPKTPQDVLIALDKIITLRPGDPRAYLAKADVLSELGAYAEALKVYNQALALDPSNADIYFGRSVAKFMLGDNNGAAQDLSMAIQLNPLMAQAYYNRGIANMNMALIPQAVSDFNQAGALFNRIGDITGYSDSLRAYNIAQNYGAALARPAARVPGGQPVPVTAPKDSPKELIAIKRNEAAVERHKSDLMASLASGSKGVVEKFKANAAVNRRGDMPGLGDLGNYEAAVRKTMAESREKADKQPQNYLDFKTSAQSKMAAGDYSGAVKDLDKAIEMSPASEHLYMDRVRANMAQKNVQAAMADLQKILSLNPGNASARLHKAQLDSAMGNNKAALEEAQKAKELFEEQGNKQGALDAQNEINRQTGKAVQAKKGDNKLEQLFAGASRDYEKGDFKAARDKFSEMIKLQPDDGSIYYNRALASTQMGDKDSAKKDLDEAIKRNDKDVKSLIARGVISAEENKFGAALEDFDAADKVSPNNPELLAGRALAKGRQGNIEGALEDIGKAVNADPENPSNYLLRATLSAQKKDFGKDFENVSGANVGEYIANLEASVADFDRAKQLLSSAGQEMPKEMSQQDEAVRALLAQLLSFREELRKQNINY